MPARSGERALALELLGTTAVVTLDQMTDGNMPGPATYIGVLVVYSGLAVLSSWQKTERLAALFGGVVLLGVLLRPTGRGPAGVKIANSLAGASIHSSTQPTHAHGVAPPSSTSSPGSIGGGAGALVPTIPNPFDVNPTDPASPLNPLNGLGLI